MQAPAAMTPREAPPVPTADEVADREQEALEARVRTYVKESMARPEPAASDRPEEEQIEAPPKSGGRWLRIAAAAVVLAGAAYGGVTLWTTARSRPGTVIIESTPPGSAVFVDGAESGTTPVTLKLAPGDHSVELRRSGRTETIALSVDPGAELTRRVEWTKAAPTGSLSITTEPPGARVTIDGNEVGVTPLTLSDLAVGRHAVVLESAAGSVADTVRIREGETSSLDVPIYSGWLAVFAPVEMQIIEGGRLLGTTTGTRIMVAPGTHEIELVSQPFGYRSTETVEVKPGEVKALTHEPKGTVSVNATPWAEVFVDGERLGETPLANVPVTIGIREFVFRHPELGEKRVTATITLNEVARVNADMTQR